MPAPEGRVAMEIIMEHFEPADPDLPGSRGRYLAKYKGSSVRFFVDKSTAEHWCVPTEVTKKFQGREIEKITVLEDEDDKKIVVVHATWDENDFDRAYNAFCVEKGRTGREEWKEKKPVHDPVADLNAYSQILGAFQIDEEDLDKLIGGEDPEP